jgi:hypothetical protein
VQGIFLHNKHWSIMRQKDIKTHLEQIKKLLEKGNWDVWERVTRPWGNRRRLCAGRPRAVRDRRRAMKPLDDVTSDWFARHHQQNRSAAARLIVSGFALLVIVVAVASMVASVVMPWLKP